MRFATKLAIMIIGIIVTFAVVVFYFVYSSSTKALEHQITDKLEVTAFHIMGKIDRMMFERYADIQIIASDPIISSKGSTPRQIRERLAVFRDYYKTYSSISFFGLNRVRITCTSGLDIGKQHSLEGYWKNALIDKGFVMDVSRSLTLRYVVIHFTFPVKDNNGETIGVVVARMPIDKLYYVITGFSEIHIESEELKIDLVDKESLLLYSSYNRKGILKDNLADWEALQRSRAGEQKGSSKHKHLGKEENIYVFVKEQGYLDFPGNDWTLILNVPTKLAFAPAVKQRNVMLFISAVALVFSVPVILFFSRSMSKPIYELTKGAEIIGKGDLKQRIVIRTKDELGQLATAFNKMTAKLKESYTGLESKVKERTVELEKARVNLEFKVAERTKELDEKVQKLNKSQRAMLYMVEDLNTTSKELKAAQERIIRSEKLATIGKLAGIMGHEIRNPLGVIKNSVYFLNMKLKMNMDKKVKRHLDILQAETNNANKIISDILEFARMKVPALVEVDINHLVKETLSRATILETVKVQTDLGEDLPKVLIDALQVGQVFSNMISNAVQAMPDGGKLYVTTDRADKFITVTFKDSGCGISEENLDKIFEPLFSTKAKGIGLGLTACRSIIDNHRGKIEVESEVNKGTTFTIKLPLTKEIKGG